MQANFLIIACYFIISLQKTKLLFLVKIVAYFYP